MTHPNPGHWAVTLWKYRSTWTYCTWNPHGGSGTSTYCGPKRFALARALAYIPKGERVPVETFHEEKLVSRETVVVGASA